MNDWTIPPPDSPGATGSLVKKSMFRAEAPLPTTYATMNSNGSMARPPHAHRKTEKARSFARRDLASLVVVKPGASTAPIAPLTATSLAPSPGHLEDGHLRGTGRRWAADELLRPPHLQPRQRRQDQGDRHQHHGQGQEGRPMHPHVGGLPELAGDDRWDGVP